MRANGQETGGRSAMVLLVGLALAATAILAVLLSGDMVPLPYRPILVALGVTCAGCAIAMGARRERLREGRLSAGTE